MLATHNINFQLLLTYRWHVVTCIMCLHVLRRQITAILHFKLSQNDWNCTQQTHSTRMKWIVNNAVPDGLLVYNEVRFQLLHFDISKRVSGLTEEALLKQARWRKSMMQARNRFVGIYVLVVQEALAYFSFLLQPETGLKKAQNLVYSYPDDLEVTLAAELIHFAAFYRTMFLYAPTPVVRNQEIREKKFRTTPWTYLTNRRNAAATILSTLIRKFYAISFTYFVL